MSIEVCPECTCRFAVGLLRCPQCSAVAPLFADRVQEEEPMPRITVAGGPTNPGAAPGEPGYVAPEGDQAAVTPASVPPAEASAPDGAEPGSSDNGPSAPVSDHAGRPVADLKADLRERGLPTSGTKAELIARLADHDQAQDADAEDPAGD